MRRDSRKAGTDFVNNMMERLDMRVLNMGHWSFYVFKADIG